MSEITPDQIRRNTVPVRHNGLIYGFLFGTLGTFIWFGGWAFIHQEQVGRYPEYFAYALKGSTGGLSFMAPQARQPGMSAAELRYSLLRYGNEDHHFDLEILRHRWYPKAEPNPASWVYHNGAVRPVYWDGALMIFKWPLTLTLLTFLVALVWGLIADYRYQNSIIVGRQLEGSVIATVKDYNRAMKGNGMRYAVNDWKDR